MAPQNSLYLVDLYQVNSAYGGLDNTLSVNFNYRDQWGGITGHPRQFLVNAHLPVVIWNGGVGAFLKSDRLGGLSLTSAGVSYNRILKQESGVISFGSSLGITQARLDGSAIITPQGIYEPGLIDHQDLLLGNRLDRGIRLDYDLSLFIGHEKFDLGISISNLFFPDQGVGDTSIDNSKNITAIGRYPVRLLDMILYPSVLIKTDLQSYQTDLSCIAKSGNVFGGLSLRGYNSQSLDAVVIIAGIEFNRNYTLSYSYDVGLNEIGSFSGGSHELNINYNLNRLLGIGLPPEIIYNPRYL